MVETKYKLPFKKSKEIEHDCGSHPPRFLGELWVPWAPIVPLTLQISLFHCPIDQT